MERLTTTLVEETRDEVLEPSVAPDHLERFEIPGEGTLWVHAAGTCLGEHCVIHKPSPHALRGLPLHWRSDRGMFERICQHGTGHPDPDQFGYWTIVGEDWQRVHGCDGCCGTDPLERET